MDKPVGYIDEHGIHVPSYEDILAFKSEQWKQIFGSDVYLDADSQEGQMLSIMALAEYDAWNFGAATYNSFSPASARGAGLDRVMKINGIKRRAATFSTADLRIVGQPGTTIYNGQAEDISGVKWNLPAYVLVPDSGEILVTATAERSGALRAQAGEINKIATPTRGWQTVGNTNEATAGVDQESDAELRVRQAKSTALPALSVFESTVAAVANVSGVNRYKGYENYNGDADTNGISGHSICIVVEGGNTLEIASAIYLKKSPGCGTYGNTTQNVIDRNGISNEIKFSRPVLTTTDISVAIRPKTGFSDAGIASLQSAVTAYLNGMNIGESLYLARLYGPIYTVGQNFEIVTIKVNNSPTDLTIPYNGLVNPGVVTITKEA